MLVLCNGMIRSGSTLQYNLVRALVEVMHRGTGEGFYKLNQYEQNRMRFYSWAEDEAIHVIKSHRLHGCVPDLANVGRVCTCYIYRDIRDVAASTKRKWGYNGTALMKVLDHAINTYYEIHETPGVLKQRYEHIVSDLPAALRALAAHVGVNPSEEMISQVVHDCSISQSRLAARNVEKNLSLAQRFKHRLDRGMPLPIRRLLRTVGLARDAYDEHTLLHPDHISEDGGATGIWSTILNEKEIEDITTRYREWLAHEGYLT